MRVGVLAVGNRFAGDDAIGPLVLDAVRDDLPAGVPAVELDGEPARILDAWDGLDAVVLVDAASSGMPVGTVHRVDLEPPCAPTVLPARGGTSSHAAGVAEALGLGRTLGRVPATVIVLAVEGRRFGPGEAPSTAVAAAVDGVARAVRDEVGRLVAVPA